MALRVVLGPPWWVVRITVLPLPHKAAITVSFQKAPLVTKEPFRLPSTATLEQGAESQLGVFCLFVCWVEVLL